MNHIACINVDYKSTRKESFYYIVLLCAFCNCNFFYRFMEEIYNAKCLNLGGTCRYGLVKLLKVLHFIKIWFYFLHEYTMCAIVYLIKIGSTF